MSSAAIAGLGMFTPIGLDAPQTAAAARAGVSRVRESSILDDRFEPIMMGFVPEECLQPLEQALPGADRFTSLVERLLRLAAPALREAVGGLKGSENVPLFLALPKFGTAVKAQIPDSFLQLLTLQAKVRLNLQESRIFRNGRAGFFGALKEVIEKVLPAGRSKFAVVGGVDSYLDLYLLAHLAQVEKRVLSSRVLDGFHPGEGAAFFLLSTPDVCEQHHIKPIASLAGIGLGQEEGHLGSDKPHKGEGLAQAFTELFAGLEDKEAKIATVFAGFNGESFFAKEWGVSFLRNRGHFEEQHQFEHPAEYIGDAGAALAPIMMGCAAMGLARGYLRNPALVWAASDESERGAAVVTVAKS